MKKLIALSPLLFLLCTVPAVAQRVAQMPPVGAASGASSSFGTRIAAVVNENVITTTDLDDRLKLAILSSGLPDNPDVRAHFVPQILRSLIDEQLQVQEAKRLDLSVGTDEVEQTLARIAHDNNIAGDMRAFVASHGGSASALTTQIRNSLLWNKVIQRELRPKVDIGDDEIDAVIERIRADAGKEEYLVSEIFLPVDNAKDEDQIKQTATNLTQQIKTGANFGAVARQFSQGAGAAQGGDIGWIQTGQLSNELNRILTNAQPGMVSDPVRTANGYHILGVRDRRTVALGDPNRGTVNLMQAFRAYPAGGNRDGVIQEANRLRGIVKQCATLEDTLSVSFPGWKAQKMGDVTAAKMPGWMADKIRGVAVGSASEVLPTDKGAVVIFVCNRKEGDAIDREAILRSIGTDKLELQARRLLRDIRRDAYLDIRVRT